MSKPQVDQVVQIDDRAVFSASTEPNWVDAAVQDVLSHQFTAIIIAENALTFRFYKDINDTWRYKP